MPTGASDILGRRLDFYILNLYYTVNFLDMYNTPREAHSIGVVFVALYAVILLLIGLPAYVDDSSYLMAAPLDEADLRWYRGYNWILLMQTSYVGVAQAYYLLSVALAQMHWLTNEHNVDLLPLYLPGCGPKAGVAADDREARKLLPSCSLMDRSVIGCQMQSLFSNPHQGLYTTTILLSSLVPVYAMLFGKSFSTHCAIGRLQLALMILCFCTLSLHFFGAVPHCKELSAQLHGARSIGPLFTGGESKILLICLFSLGIGNFGNAVLGSRVGERVKQNFVLLMAAICVSDFGVGNVLFNVVNLMRRAAVQSLCKFNGSESYDAFMDLNGSATIVGSSRMLEVENYGVSDTAESIMMFRETSGQVPWTVVLPFEIMSLAFTTLLICNYFYICDLQAATVFTEKKCLIVILSLSRFGLIIALEFLQVTGIFPEMGVYLDSGTTLAFLSLRMVQCVIIHVRQGFSKFLQAKSQLISTDNYVQRFAFDWYIGPAIVYLYNLGYPLIFALVILVNQGDMLHSTKFLIFFLVTNVLPSSVIMTASYLLEF